MLQLTYFTKNKLEQHIDDSGSQALNDLVNWSRDTCRTNSILKEILILMIE